MGEATVFCKKSLSSQALPKRSEQPSAIPQKRQNHKHGLPYCHWCVEITDCINILHILNSGPQAPHVLRLLQGAERHSAQDPDCPVLIAHGDRIARSKFKVRETELFKISCRDNVLLLLILFQVEHPWAIGWSPSTGEAVGQSPGIRPQIWRVQDDDARGAERLLLL